MGNSPTSAPTTQDSGDNAWVSMGAQQLQDVLNSLMEQKPKPDDYKDYKGQADAASYQKALADWGKNFGAISSQLHTLTINAAGFHTLPDGSMIATGDLTPDQRAQLDQANKLAYQSTMRKLGLDQYDVTRTAINDENQRRQQEFQNQNDVWDRLLGLDKMSADQASKKLDRWLSIRQEADKGAQLQQTAQQEAIKYGTSPGKSSFSARDLGGIFERMAGLAGVDPNTPMLSYPGTQTMDPMADINNAAAAMGGGGAAPMLDFPQLATPGNMPTPPSFNSAGAPPMLSFPDQTDPTKQPHIGAPNGMLLPPPAPGLSPWSPSGVAATNPTAGV